MSEELSQLFDKAFDKFLFPIQVQRSLSGEGYLVSLHNGVGTLDGYTGETLEEALAKAIVEHSETR